MIRSIFRRIRGWIAAKQAAQLESLRRGSDCFWVPRAGDSTGDFIKQKPTLEEFLASAKKRIEEDKIKEEGK